MDARSLLRDHKAGTSAGPSVDAIPSHATVTAGGTLKCTLCQLAGIKHWESHSISKQHRQALARFNKIDAAAAEAAAARKRTAEDNERGGKRRKLDGAEVVAVAEPVVAPAVMTPTPIDSELDSFLSSIADDVAAPRDMPKNPYIPSQPPSQVSYESAPIRNIPAVNVVEDEPVEETEGERRKREEREDKEEIMDRLMDEQRAQEDADQRVTSLKAKLEMVRRRRAEMAKEKAEKA